MVADPIVTGAGAAPDTDPGRVVAEQGLPSAPLPAPRLQDRQHTGVTGRMASRIDMLIARGRRAQAVFGGWSQVAVDEAVAAAAWAIMAPERNRRLAEQAVRDTGFGDVEDKVRKNHRKTLGLLRDLDGQRTVGVITEDPRKGITEIARPVGIVAAVTPSTNPVATPANNLINAIKARDAIILAPSPKGAATCRLLLQYVHEALARVGAPVDLVQQLPPPGSKVQLDELMAKADLVVATGSRANVEAAYRSGTPALGVGAGNVAAIVLPGGDATAAAKRIAASKTFDHATSCSSENSVVAVGGVCKTLVPALAAQGGVFATAEERAALAARMFADGRPTPDCIARPAAEIAARAGLPTVRYADARFIVVEGEGVGVSDPFSGEKLSPVLALYRVPDLAAAVELVRRIYDHQGKGHSVGVHGASEAELRLLAEQLPVARVIADQIHCLAVGGAFNNGLPFSLSMGCGTWGRNSFSDNLNVRHFLNVTRIVRPIPESVPDEATLLGAYWAKYGR